MKLLHSIRGKMFIAYASLLLVLVMIFFILYYNHTSEMLTENASQSLQQLSANTCNNLDFYIKNLDSTASRVVSSSLLKEAFYQNTSSESEQLENYHELTDILFNITAFDTENTIHILGENGKLLKYGKCFDLVYLSESQIQMLLPELEKGYPSKGRLYISNAPLIPCEDSENFTFSVCRSMNRSFIDDYDACVEVQADYEDLSHLMESAIGSGKTRILLYDQDGHLLYPKAGTENTGGYFQAIPSESTSGTLTFTSGDTREVAAYHHSVYSGITLLALQNEEDLYLPLVAFRNQLIIIAAFALLLTSLIVSLLASQLTRPIHNLQKSINALKLDELDPSELKLYKPSTSELADLRNAYLEMITRLRSSLDETVTARSQEIRARIMALLAQMNPHFLYNTITIISARAEEYNADDAVEMCETLVSMLRYVTKESYGTVPLHQEIRHLEQFLYLMQCRYPKQFSSEIDLPDEMDDLEVPKLILQPLVENSFKHGFQTKSLWKLHVSGRIMEDLWEISITDNGVGFSENVLENLKNELQLSSGDLEHMDTDFNGIGLSNIFHRLKYLYKDRFKFEIVNLPQGGCSITIGGFCRYIESDIKLKGE